jgi:DNA-binding LytR/AlgR family response regulator
MLDASGGMQVHRSHWVRLGAVHDIGTADGRMVLRLPGDLEVPVSRRYRASVRAALASATGA